MNDHDALIALFEDAVRDSAWSHGVRQANANGTGLLIRPVQTNEALVSLRAAAAKAVKDFVTSPRICGPTMETHVYATGANLAHEQWWRVEYPTGPVAPSTLLENDAYLTPRGVSHAYEELMAEAQA